MAGAGYKLFNTGDVLTAAQVNTYLQEQTVMVFDDATARTTALSGVLAEGMVSYLKDTNEVEKYNGSSWVSIGGTAAVVPDLLAGKNKIHNSNFQVAQRGTSFTSTSGANNDDAYTLDRWYLLTDGNDAIDVTQSTDAPTNGLNSIALDVETINKKFGIAQIIEQKDSIGLIGNSVTFSFYAKVSSTTKLDNVKAAIVAWSGTADTVTSDIISAWNVEGTNPTLIANATYENSPANLNVTTSWARYSVTATIDTASTKNIIVFIWSDVTDTTLGDFLYITDVQLEKGSSATAYAPANATTQGELSTCQRYFVRFGDTNQGYGVMSWGQAYSTTHVMSFVPLPVTMRVKPSSISFTGLRVNDWTSYISVTTMAIENNYTTPQLLALDATVTGATTKIPYTLGQDNNTAGKLEVSAEL